MAADRTVRSLSSLAHASSSRVLNLLAIGQAQADNGGHRSAPLFDSAAINNSIIVKHRLRANELEWFAERRLLATKVIIPFERSNLRVGGRSFFVGQQGFDAMLREAGNYRNEASMKRDADILRLIDSVPSLDPFLLREYLRCNDIHPDASYFGMSASDQQGMHDCAAREISRLTSMASGKSAGAGSSSTTRMVEALLSSEASERLEPLRATLKLAPAEFSEGVFSWRGFIYYKWSMGEFWPNLVRTLRDLKAIRPMGKVSSDEAKLLGHSKEAIIRSARDNANAVRSVIKIYDEAYESLIDRQDPKTFREFLLGAPALFLEIGEKMGAMSHLTSFWQYRFPPGAPKLADVEELIVIFQDFIRNFGQENLLAA